MNKRLQLCLALALTVFSVVAALTFLAGTFYGLLLVVVSWIIVYVVIAFWNKERRARSYTEIGLTTFFVGGIVLSGLFILAWAIDKHSCLQFRALNPLTLGYCRPLSETLSQSKKSFLGIFGFSAVLSFILFRLAAGIFRRHRSS